MKLIITFVGLKLFVGPWKPQGPLVTVLVMPNGSKSPEAGLCRGDVKQLLLREKISELKEEEGAGTGVGLPWVRPHPLNIAAEQPAAFQDCEKDTSVLEAKL